MNYQAAIAFGQQQMERIGKKPQDYFWEPVQIIPTLSQQTAGLIEITAYNEYWILVNPENYFGLFIISDVSAFNSDKREQNGVPEFTGIIRLIKIAATWNLEYTLDPIYSISIAPKPVDFIRFIIH